MLQNQSNPLEREFALNVVRPRLIDLVAKRPPTSASDLYLAWIETYPHCSRARFDRWLAELGVQFERRVVVRGLHDEPSHVPIASTLDASFDHE
jgi:hypothetical protein